jgi:ketosteroid isomerase-like protein
MSREDVDIVRRALKARRSEFAELLDPAVHLDLSERVFNPAVYEGYEGIMRWHAEVGEIWQSYVTEPDEFIDCDRGVLVLTRERGRGRASGVELDRETALICRLRARRVSEIRQYDDRDRAVRDAGPSAERPDGEPGQAMAQQNMELVQRAIAALNARDIEGYLACCTDDVTLETPLATVGGVYEAAEGIRRFLTDIEDAAPDFQIAIDRAQAIDGQRLVAFVRSSSTGRTSGIPLVTDATNVYDIREGKISRIRIFLDRREALEAVGLTE